MKLLLTLSLLAIILASVFGKRTKEEEDKIAEEYFEKFNKYRGRSQKDIERRKKIVIDRFNKIEEHNEKFLKGEELYVQALNEFSDLTDEEFEHNLTGIRFPEDYTPNRNETNPPLPKDSRPTNAIPTNWNWIKSIRPVQNQKKCGSSYVFAAIGALESSICRRFDQCQKLSEQEAMECTNGCNGGWHEEVFEYSRKRGGCAFDSNYPYKGYVTKNCTSNGPRVPKSKMYTWKNLPNNADDIKEFIYYNAAVYAVLKVYQPFYSYGGGIFTGAGCSGDNGAWHAVLITGYGEENKRKYWIGKNSWGTSWGDKGFFKIERGRDCAKIESTAVAFPWTL